MNDCKKLGYRKTALTKQGAFTPSKKGMRSGVGIVKDQPKKPEVKPQ